MSIEIRRITIETTSVQVKSASFVVEALNAGLQISAGGEPLFWTKRSVVHEVGEDKKGAST